MVLLVRQGPVVGGHLLMAWQSSFLGGLKDLDATARGETHLIPPNVQSALRLDLGDDGLDLKGKIVPQVLIVWAAQHHPEAQQSQFLQLAGFGDAR